MKDAKVESRPVGRASGAGGTLASIRSFPGQTKVFLGDVRSELRRVTWPSRKQIRATTLVVILTVFFFGVYFGILDWIFSAAVSRLFRFLG
ncbi:MAG: preprotein translocase subunit SecE [Acidobacteria bacterium]|nr:preprotein translocase subunit SecE [Acidobacteriota bacterium]